MGTAALVLGIGGLIVGWAPYIAFIGWIAGILAIILGAIRLLNAPIGKAIAQKSALAGLALGITVSVIEMPLMLTIWKVSGAESSDEASSADGSTEESRSGHDDEGGSASSGTEELEGVGEGVWAVGTDIEPGTYVTTTQEFDHCYVERLSGFGGEAEDRIANGNLDDGARGRITIDETDAGVEFSGDCRWQLADSSNLAAPGNEVGAGFWEVGTEVEPGTYVTTADDDGHCYFARISGFSWDFYDLIANGNVADGAQGRVTIDASDAGVEFSGNCVWTLQ